MSGIVDIMFRVTVDELPEDFLRWFKKQDSKFLVKEYGDAGDNPHFQGLLSGNLNSVRSTFKRHFIGNGQYSIKKTDDVPRTVQYLCKGPSACDMPEVIFNIGFNVDSLHEAYWLEQAESKTKSRKAKKETGNLLYRCYSDIKSTLSSDTAPINVGVAILKWYSEHDLRVPSQFNMGTMISTYLLWLSRDSGAEIEPCLFRRLYPNLGF